MKAPRARARLVIVVIAIAAMPISAVFVAAVAVSRMSRQVASDRRCEKVHAGTALADRVRLTVGFCVRRLDRDREPADTMDEAFLHLVRAA
jgi:hypothetical protein